MCSIKDFGGLLLEKANCPQAASISKPLEDLIITITPFALSDCINARNVCSAAGFKVAEIPVGEVNSIS